MCNPRRVRVTATRQLIEAWEREIARSVELSGLVTGEARVHQQLDTCLGRPALRALERLLATGEAGWTAVDAGYRFDVEGGYVLYLVDEGALEIVAQISDEVRVSGEARARLGGTLDTVLEAQGEGTYYDDGYGQRTRESAEREAQAAAQRALDDLARQQLRRAQHDAEAAAAGDLEAEAHREAQRELDRQAVARREQLAAGARAQLDSVGLHCRQAFHRLLARSYRDAILAYAREHYAEGIECREDGHVIDIEFHVQR